MQNIARRVDDVIFTHPHMDHIGEALELTRLDDTSPKIHTTPGTKIATHIALTDAVKIALNEYEKKVIGFETFVDKTLRPARQFVLEYETRGK